MGSKPMILFQVEGCMPIGEEECKIFWHETKLKLEKLRGPSYFFTSYINGNGTEDGIFINIPSLLVTLKLNYDILAKIAKEEFNPEKVIEELENPNSFFWKKLFVRHAGMGILLGFGQRNALLMEIGERFPVARVSDVERAVSTWFKEDWVVEDLPLPNFVSFNLGDEVFAKYQHERKEIFKYLKKRDFEKTVKEWLSQREDESVRILEFP